MRTDDLIALLATDTAPIHGDRVGARLRLASAAAASSALIVLLAWLGPRADLMAAIHTSMFWMKAGYTLWLALGGFMLTVRLARPDGRPGPARWVLAAAFIAIGVLGAINFSLAPTGQKSEALMGHSWALCPWRIAVIATPAFAAVILGLRRFAPTRLALAGAAAGLLAGAIGATVYGLACTEVTAAFVATWYTLGIAVCAAVGAVLGRWLLRW